MSKRSRFCGALPVTIIGALLCGSTAAAQMPAPAEGRIIGRVLDAQTGAGLSAVSVQVVGSPLGAISGVAGRYVINNVPSGKATLRATTIGYAIKTITGVAVDAGEIGRASCRERV